MQTLLLTRYIYSPEVDHLGIFWGRPVRGAFLEAPGSWGLLGPHGELRGQAPVMWRIDRHGDTSTVAPIDD